jgi:hypothetical protein
MKLFKFIFENITKFKDINSEIENLKTLSFQEIKRKYVLNKIGGGENKNLYMTFAPGKYLLKLTKEDSEELKKEIEIFECFQSNLLTKIYGYDSISHSWAVFEQVSTVSEKEFETLLLASLKGTGLSEILLNNSKNNQSSIGREFVRWLRVPNLEMIIPNYWLKELLRLIDGCNLDPNDLYYQNWGTRNGKDLVILDYGFEGFEDGN